MDNRKRGLRVEFGAVGRQHGTPIVLVLSGGDIFNQCLQREPQIADDTDIARVFASDFVCILVNLDKRLRQLHTPTPRINRRKPRPDADEAVGVLQCLLA